MKLLLTSAGVTNQMIVDELDKLTDGTNRKVGFIPTAANVEPGNKDWFIHQFNNLLKFGYDWIDVINLANPDVNWQDRLKETDIIFMSGGNTDYLMHIFNKTGFADLLPKLLETKVYVGSSAGSMVIGKRVSTAAYQAIYGEDQDFGATEYMGLVDLAIKPHLDSNNFPNNRAEILDEHASGTDFPVYGLKDDSAIVIDGDNIEFIGSPAHEVQG